MIFLIKALQLILALSILVVVHEFGHFGFARLFKVRVNKFYLFFNPRFSIFRAKKINGKWQTKFFSRNLPEHEVQAVDENGVPKTDKKGKPIMIPDDINKLPADDWRRYPESTEWGIGWVPFGGYCAIAGMVDETTKESSLSSEPQQWEYRSRKPWQRFFMIVGGVLFNFILAILIFAMLLFKNGEEVLPVRNAYLGYKYCRTALDNGFRNGDIIVAIDGGEANSSKDVIEKLVIEGKRNVTVSRNGETTTVCLPENFGEQFIEAKEKQFMTPVIPFVVDSVMPQSAAMSRGLQRGDSIVGVGGKPLTDVEDIMAAITDNAGKMTTIDFYRRGSLVSDSIMPDENGKIGVVLRDPTHIFETEKIRYGFFAAFPAGIRMGWETLVSYVKQFRLVFTKAGAKSVGGFAAIGNLFPSQWNWTIFWSMTALLSVILAFMNILPIPFLDGGYILFIIYEMITGKKPSDKFMEISLNIGMIFVLGLLVFANGNDLLKWITSMF